MKKIIIGSVSLAALGLAFGGIVSAQNMNSGSNTNSNQSNSNSQVNFMSESVLRVGSRGQDVVTLQMFLQGRGFLRMPNGVAYGYFGKLTSSALAQYQASIGLTPSGNFDSTTRGKVMSEMNMSGNGNQMNSNPNTKAASLRVLLNSINREHANLASIALRKGFDGAADFQASAKALDNNSIEIAKSVGSVYGPEAEREFLEIWRSHINFFVDYTVASKANDNTKKAKAVSDLAGYVNRISDFLSKANPNLPREAVHQVVTEHVRLLRSTIDKHFAGDYEASYTEQHATDVQIGTQVADTVAGAIVKQFPEKF
jgi:peptidoglycan hydrolase-like protein with peptidoglycan-binding domain